MNNIDYNNIILIEYVEYDKINTPIMLKIPNEYANPVRCIGEYKKILNLKPPKKRTIDVFMVASKEEKYKKIIEDRTNKLIEELHREYSYLPIYIIDLDGNIIDGRKK